MIHTNYKLEADRIEKKRIEYMLKAGQIESIPLRMPIYSKKNKQIDNGIIDIFVKSDKPMRANQVMEKLEKSGIVATNTCVRNKLARMVQNCRLSRVKVGLYEINNEVNNNIISNIAKNNVLSVFNDVEKLNYTTAYQMMRKKGCRYSYSTLKREVDKLARRGILEKVSSGIFKKKWTRV